MTELTAKHREALIALAQALVDQRAAKVIVPAQKPSTGYWFGGGNMIRERGGRLLVIGRYRNYGDSRTGIGVGERGLELAVFGAPDFSAPFTKVKSFAKADLHVDGKAVLSIEGAKLHESGAGLEVFVSTEKDIPYPKPVAEFRKPGTGVWSIELFEGTSAETLDAAGIRTVLQPGEPPVLHVKDPVVFDRENGETVLAYCTHPFAWSSSNTGAAIREAGSGDFRRVTECVLPRGNVWDVAMTRVTDRMPVPRLGLFADLPPLSLFFYDGGECVRPLDEHAKAKKRPRGYSCEEIGGLAVGFDADFPRLERLSVNGPLFLSPYGTACSRYVSTLVEADAIYATWQQSQKNLSQPLVGHALPMEKAERLLQG